MNTGTKQRAKHPNRIPFEGVLCRVDEPSDNTPGGSESHCVLLTRAAAEEALETLEGMPLGFSTEWDKHGQRNRCGVILKAWIDERDVWVRGHLFLLDYPEVATYLSKPGIEMGMSYELADARVRNVRLPVWELTHVTFTGAAVLLRDKAAYRKTSFRITASTEPAPQPPQAENKRFDGVLYFEDAGKIKTLPAIRYEEPS